MTQIRRADSDDLDLVAALRLAFVAEERRLDRAALAPEFEEATRAFVSQVHADGRAATWLALDDAGAVAGVVTLLFDDRPPLPDEPRTAEGYVVNMYVEPAARGAGVGRRLLHELLAHARQAGTAHGVPRGDRRRPAPLRARRLPSPPGSPPRAPALRWYLN